MKRLLFVLCIACWAGQVLAEEWTRPTKEIWTGMVSDLAELSAQQNQGKPKLERFCEPELKTCTVVLSARRPDGGELAFLEIEDSAGELLARQTCTVNATHDVRNCLNMEDDGTQQFMKGMDGNWKMIEKLQ